jgi:hypothetical protein
MFILKKIIIALLVLCFTVSGKAQHYYDNIWVSSEGVGDAVLIDFSQGEPNILNAPISLGMEGASASICNAEGDLQFYTNGCHVFNWQHRVMENGIGLNRGAVYDDYCSLFFDIPLGYPMQPQSTTILPWPGREDQYLIFHLRIDYNFDPSDDRGADVNNLFYTSVDMLANEEEGRVVAKNISLDTTLREPKLVAVRHANGDDWWLLNPLVENNLIQSYLIDSSGVHFGGEQPIGLVDDSRDRSADQYVFTPQGDKLLRFSVQKGLSIFDFDRETAELSNFQLIDFPQGTPDTFVFAGVGVSPSGQFAYVSNAFGIYQYDLWADTIANSQYQVAELGNPDSLFLHPTGQIFQLGPDCKLYCYAVSGNAHHVIHQPDEQGEACDWEQGGLPLGTWVFRDQPTFPNFRLGPLGDEGSPCAEPIVSTEEPLVVPDVEELMVFPNPASSIVQFVSPKEKIVGFVLYDALGRQVSVGKELVLPGENGRLSVAELPTGYYRLQFRLGNGQTVARSIVVK